jgi:hypothetical protein
LAEEKILAKVDENRRGFLKRVLGAGFAVPVIAAFSMESLTVDSAHATDISNTTDVGNQSLDDNLFTYLYFT